MKCQFKAYCFHMYHIEPISFHIHFIEDKFTIYFVRNKWFKSFMLRSGVCRLYCSFAFSNKNVSNVGTSFIIIGRCYISAITLVAKDWNKILASDVSCLILEDWCNTTAMWSSEHWCYLQPFIHLSLMSQVF